MALWAATRRPDLVSELVMISGAFDPNGLIIRPDAEGEWPPQVVAAYGEVSPDGEAHFPVVAKKIADSVDQGSPLTITDVEQVTCPALVVAADDDIVTLEHTIELYRALPESTRSDAAGRGCGACPQQGLVGTPVRWRTQRAFAASCGFSLVLLRIARRDNHKELGELTGLAPASITDMIGRLQAGGLVRRRAHPDDGAVS